MAPTVPSLTVIEGERPDLPPSAELLAFYRAGRLDERAAILAACPPSLRLALSGLEAFRVSPVTLADVTSVAQARITEAGRP